MDAAIDTLFPNVTYFINVNICVLNNLWFAGQAEIIRRGGYILGCMYNVPLFVITI